MNSTTSHSREVKSIRKAMLAATTKLRAAISDDNALMADNDIITIMQELEDLRTQYAAAAWTAHEKYCETL